MQAAIERFRQYLTRQYPNRSTTKHYSSDLKIFSQFTKRVDPKEITPKMIDDFVQQQSQAGLKGSTINRRLASLSSFYDFLIEEAEDDNWLNPVRWKRHGIKRGHHLPRDVSDETVQRLFAVIDDVRDRAIFVLMISAGLRVGEVINIQVSDIPNLESTILGRLRVSGKGDKERITWLTNETLRPIHTWLEQRPQSQANHLFLNQHGHPLSVSGVQYRLKQYCQQAAVKVTCHQLRHTFARRLAEHNMPLDSLAKLLGHHNLQTTQLYIDGANPTVRRDFETAMTKGRSNPVSPAVVRQMPAMVQAPEERPDAGTIVDHLGHLAVDLPAWLQQAIRTDTMRRISGWQAHQARLHAHNHFAGLCRTGRWLVQHRHWSTLAQLQRTDLAAFVQASQARGLKPQSIGVELKRFQRFWRNLLDQAQVTNGAILLVKAPAITRDPLPRFLTGAEFERLAQAVLTATETDTAQDRFDRVWFYLLAHAGLRKGEVLNLRLDDCDLSGRRLRIQAGKGDQDRIIPMSTQLVTVIEQYLAVRPAVATNHLLIYRDQPLKRGLMTYRLRKFALAAEITSVSPHRLRHTLATFLVNQGMPITSVQKFLGHRDINKTLIYARVHDETVHQHFATAMAQIEAVPVLDWPQSQQAEPAVSVPSTISGHSV